MAKKNEETLPAVQETTTTAPALQGDIFGDGDSGFENCGAQDFALPFLKILQALSPQCIDGDPKFIEEARPGMFINSVTDEITSGKTGLLFVPCYYRRLGTLWVPREEGGGFRGSVDVAEMEQILRTTTRDDKNNDVMEDGNHILDTREWYGLIISEDGKEMSPVLLTLSKTGIKVSKKWLSLAQGIRVDGREVKMWSQVYHLNTVIDKRDAGTFFALEVKHHGTVPTREVFEAAASFREQIRSGAIKAQIPEDEATSFDPDKF